jgi:hypothetical protein
MVANKAKLAFYNFKLIWHPIPDLCFHFLKKVKIIAAYCGKCTHTGGSQYCWANIDQRQPALLDTV